MTDLLKRIFRAVKPYDMDADIDGLRNRLVEHRSDNEKAMQANDAAVSRLIQKSGELTVVNRKAGLILQNI